MKKSEKGLTKIEIMFWEGHGECKPSSCKFRMGIVRNGLVDYVVGTPSSLRKRMKFIESWYSVSLPKVSWKSIVGNDDGGSLYKWSNK